MAIHIGRVYTRTGDKGETGLVGGKRVPKDSPRIRAYGTLDELNAIVGIARIVAGLHTPLDVGGSVVIATALTIVAHALLRRSFVSPCSRSSQKTAAESKSRPTQ